MVVGSDFCQRFEHELAVGHQRMRQRKVGGLEVAVAVLEEVDVDGAVVVPSVAFDVASEFAFYLLGNGKDVVGVEFCLEDGGGIQEHVVALHVYGCRLVERRAFDEFSYTLADELHGLADIVGPVAEV